MAIISDDHNIMNKVFFSKAKSINYNGNLEVANSIPSVKRLLIQKSQECYSCTETSECRKITNRVNPQQHYVTVPCLAIMMMTHKDVMFGHVSELLNRQSFFFLQRDDH